MIKKSKLQIKHNQPIAMQPDMSIMLRRSRRVEGSPCWVCGVVRKLAGARWPKLSRSRARFGLICSNSDSG